MDRFWFPPQLFHLLLGGVTGVSLVFTLSFKAIAQSSLVQTSGLTEQPTDAQNLIDLTAFEEVEKALELDPQASAPQSFGSNTVEQATEAQSFNGRPADVIVSSTSDWTIDRLNDLTSEHLLSNSSETTNTYTFTSQPTLQALVKPRLQRKDPIFAVAGRRDSPNGAPNQVQYQVPNHALDTALQHEGRSQGDVSLESNEPETSTTNTANVSPNTANIVPISDSTYLDPELGILRLRPLSNSLSEASSNAIIDPELGVLRLRHLPSATASPTAQPDETVMFAQGTIGFFSGNNLLARTEALADTTLQTGLTLRAVPRIGSRTFVVGTAGGNVLKYAAHGEFDYRELDLSLGLYHWLNRQTYVDVGWRNQQFFAEEGGDRFLNDHQARLSLGRIDQLTPKLQLNSSYQLQASWTDPTERSRLINRFNLGLSHPLTSSIDASVFYQFALIDFTQQDRYDSYHQFLAQLQFDLSEETTLTIFGGGRLGDSTHSLIDFDSTLVGLSFGMNFGLF